MAFNNHSSRIRTSTLSRFNIVPMSVSCSCRLWSSLSQHSTRNRAMILYRCITDTAPLRRESCSCPAAARICLVTIRHKFICSSISGQMLQRLLLVLLHRLCHYMVSVAKKSKKSGAQCQQISLPSQLLPIENYIIIHYSLLVVPSG